MTKMTSKCHQNDRRRTVKELLGDRQARAELDFGDPRGSTAFHHACAGGHVETLEVDACMVATGRVPNTKNMGLEALGVETVRGFVQVDETMRVLTKEGGEVVPGLWCIGDANGND